MQNNNKISILFTRQFIQFIVIHKVALGISSWCKWHIMKRPSVLSELFIQTNYVVTQPHDSLMLKILATNTVNIMARQPTLPDTCEQIPIHFKLAVSISLNFQITHTCMYPDDALINTERITCKNQIKHFHMSAVKR